ncbi:RICIN domain-containing protein [Kitasatospora sp. NPDC057015]|uniref:RICIN domain-containing protein n=1 Tax=Kitasatospora sp. NPDC057015 TaxID=3346001 RepID=UPI00362BA211
MNRKMLGLLAVPSVLASVLASAGSASAGQTGTDSVINPPGIYHLSTETSLNRCLVVFANGSQGSAATLTQCAAFDDQSWSVPAAGTTGEIRNKYYKNTYGTGCLTVQGDSLGAPAFIYDCTGLRDQKWSAELIPFHNGSVRLRNVNSGKCLVVQGSSDGTAAMQYTCGNFADQYWLA